MTPDRPLLPAEFEKRILFTERPGVEPGALAEEIARLSRARHPAITALDPDAFPVPMAVALHLYRHDPNARQALVMSAVGRAGPAEFWERLAAAAREAYRAGDFVLIGALAHRAEVEHALTGGAAADPLLSALNWLLRPGCLAEADRVRVALGYLRFIAASFVIPRDLGPAGDAPAKTATDWPLLRLAWQALAVMQAVEPGLPAKLARAPNRFVREAAAVEPPEPPVPAPRAKPPKRNPFSGLARGSCINPPSAEAEPPPPAAAPRPLPTILRPIELDDAEPLAAVPVERPGRWWPWSRGGSAS